MGRTRCIGDPGQGAIPGGYQVVGRTLQRWDRWRDARHGALEFEPGMPWLLRFFVQIRFFPVEADELLIRRGSSGRAVPSWEPP